MWSYGSEGCVERPCGTAAETGRTAALTSDRFNSWSPAWGADGKWIWFLSDRTLRTLVPSPWGTRQPDPACRPRRHQTLYGRNFPLKVSVPTRCIRRNSVEDVGSSIIRLGERLSFNTAGNPPA